MTDVVIASAARTALGGFQGTLSALDAPALGAKAIAAALARAQVKPEDIEEVAMGCVLPAGLGQAPARQAALQAGLPAATPCATINKVCGSGMKTVMLAADAILSGRSNLVVAGGMESMSNAPYLLPKARGGMRLGHGEVKDHMFLDGLEDAYSPETRGRLMGAFAEDTARHYQFPRVLQDAYAIESLDRAQAAQRSGALEREIVPVTIKSRAGETAVREDEQPLTAKKEKIPQLKPAFAADGTVTAANSSSISDGAAALVVMSAAEAKRRGTKPLARIIAQASYAGEPRWFTTAPIFAIQKLLTSAGWNLKDIDLFEINEAFAVVAMAAMRDLSIPRDRLNVNGGACALGHPIGASGARILVTLLHAMEARNAKKGVAAICIGGGEATALAIERA
ncbi:MAG: acetyl-CoA C-acyltransferase [Alphaproteobacteria bacterium]